MFHNFPQCYASIPTVNSQSLTGGLASLDTVAGGDVETTSPQDPMALGNRGTVQRVFGGANSYHYRNHQKDREKGRKVMKTHVFSMILLV